MHIFPPELEIKNTKEIVYSLLPESNQNCYVIEIFVILTAPERETKYEGLIIISMNIFEKSCYLKTI